MNRTCSFSLFQARNDCTCSLSMTDPSVKLEDAVLTSSGNVQDFVLSPTLSSICLPEDQNELLVIPPSCFNSTVRNERLPLSPTERESSHGDSMASTYCQGVTNCTTTLDNRIKGFTYLFDFAQQPFIARTNEILEFSEHLPQDHLRNKEAYDVEMITFDEIFKEVENIKLEAMNPNEHNLNSLGHIPKNCIVQEDEKATVNFKKCAPHNASHIGKLDLATQSCRGLAFDAAYVLQLSSERKQECILDFTASENVLGNTRHFKRLGQSEVSTARWWSYGSRAWGSREDGGVYINGVLQDFTEEDDNKTYKSMEEVAEKKRPSRFCHICLRKAERVTVVACGHIFSGQCRKVVCRRCFKEQGWDWDTAITKGSGWACPHCRNV